jgi:hypothetical protein
MISGYFNPEAAGAGRSEEVAPTQPGFSPGTRDGQQNADQIFRRPPGGGRAFLCFWTGSAARILSPAGRRVELEAAAWGWSQLGWQMGKKNKIKWIEKK